MSILTILILNRWQCSRMVLFIHSSLLLFPNTFIKDWMCANRQDIRWTLHSAHSSLALKVVKTQSNATSPKISDIHCSQWTQMVAINIIIPNVPTWISGFIWKWVWLFVELGFCFRTKTVSEYYECAVLYGLSTVESACFEWFENNIMCKQSRSLLKQIRYEIILPVMLCWNFDVYGSAQWST